MNQTLSSLFVSFCLIGIGAYGGGLVTVPLIQHEITENHDWLSQQEMGRIVAIAQMTPGPIAINAATFVGYRVAGIGGAIVATTAVVLPSITILFILSHIVRRVGSRESVRRLRTGMHAGVLSLLLFAVWSYGRGVVSGAPELGIAVAAFLTLVAFDRRIHPLIVIVAAGLVGLLIF
ncbi:MAG: chromate transporter [Sedimentisphaerales bacterium]|jgi:chromate transporter|nr:chromate transporter [Planctomycetota bacterium]MDY0356534.1 chromate transporter [Sedimentisphaerales bacterium]NLT77298.1 chromate transporter [Planctomycetota bacterium]